MPHILVPLCNICKTVNIILCSGINFDYYAITIRIINITRIVFVTNSAGLQL